MAAYPKAKKSGVKRKAPEGPGFKQLKLKIVALPKMLKRTPTGAAYPQLVDKH